MNGSAGRIGPPLQGSGNLVRASSRAFSPGCHVDGFQPWRLVLQPPCIEDGLVTATIPLAHHVSGQGETPMPRQAGVLLRPATSRIQAGVWMDT
jgi:hypothetical protein